MPQTVATKPYDWTYTTTYAGHPSSHTADQPPTHSSPPVGPTIPIPWTPADPNIPFHTIPIAELTRPDPILFYAEIPLFEDELHDNGSSNLLVRIVRTSSLTAFLIVDSLLSIPRSWLEIACNANVYIYSITIHIACG